MVVVSWIALLPIVSLCFGVSSSPSLTSSLESTLAYLDSGRRSGPHSQHNMNFGKALSWCGRGAEFGGAGVEKGAGGREGGEQGDEGVHTWLREEELRRREERRMTSELGRTSCSTRDSVLRWMVGGLSSTGTRELRLRGGGTHDGNRKRKKKQQARFHTCSL
eukprot:3723258-Rhodomonas_salina.2